MGWNGTIPRWRRMNSSWFKETVILPSIGPLSSWGNYLLSNQTFILIFYCLEIGREHVNYIHNLQRVSILLEPLIMVQHLRWKADQILTALAVLNTLENPLTRNQNPVPMCGWCQMTGNGMKKIPFTLFVILKVETQWGTWSILCVEAIR